MALFRLIPAGDAELFPSPTAPGKRVFALVTGPRYVKQKIASRMRFFLGEWFLDTRLGVPYRDIFVKNPDIDKARTFIRTVLGSIQEVKSVRSIDVVYDPVARALSVNFDVQLVDGGILQIRQPDPAFIFPTQSAA